MQGAPFRVLSTSPVRWRLLLTGLQGNRTQDMREFQVIEILIETKDNDSLKKYRGYGILDRLEKTPGSGSGF